VLPPWRTRIVLLAALARVYRRVGTPLIFVVLGVGFVGRSEKVTVPAGVPEPVLLTVAVSVTDWPNTGAGTEELTLVVVAVPTAVPPTRSATTLFAIGVPSPVTRS